MGRFCGGALVHPARREDDEDLFEAPSSVSGDSDDEARLSELEGVEAPQGCWRRLNFDSLYDMSSVKAELPVKRGLSRYYDGKSQSYACMSEVRCLEDLRKKVRTAADLDDGSQEACPAPGARGKPAGSSCANLMARNAPAAGMLYRPPAIHVNKCAYRQ